jgi:two-component system response regulator MprA
MSAHPAQVLAQHGLTSLNVPFLAKPYTRGEVLAKVAEALERRRKKQRVLVVHDDATMRSTLARMLTVAGYEAALADDANVAARLWEERPADLVILGLSTPEEDGLDTIAELRGFSHGVPIIAMSREERSTNIDLRHDAKLLGATVTVEEPFMPAEVMQLVDAVLLGSRKRGPS